MLMRNDITKSYQWWFFPPRKSSRLRIWEFVIERNTLIFI